ncbi:MAG: D-alanyl-D-alanine carboxypeptidase family protein [Akkermansia sp.]
MKTEVKSGRLDRMRGFNYALSFIFSLLLVSCGGIEHSNQIFKPEPQSTQHKTPTPRMLNNMKPLPTPPTAAPSTSCKALCVIDPRTGRILYSHNANTRRQVASTQKIMTALCVTDAGNLGRSITIKSADHKVPRIRMDLPAGDRYKCYDLLRAMLTSSFNDVAMTLARDTGGSVNAFVARMNARAKKMGMTNSHFANPSGLPGQQYSTARDMAIAACYAYNNNVIRQCINTESYSFKLNNGRSRTIKSTNKLLHNYPYVTGMKTGYTNAAGKCLISCANVGPYAVIVVALGSSNAKIWGESIKYINWALQIP